MDGDANHPIQITSSDDEADDKSRAMLNLARNNNTYIHIIEFLKAVTEIILQQ